MNENDGVVEVGEREEMSSKDGIQIQGEVDSEDQEVLNQKLKAASTGKKVSKSLGI